jgi:hypothetical protein
MESDNAKMMKSYFTTGEEMRRFFQQQRLGNRIFSESGQVVNSFASILGGSQISNAFSTITGNFQNLEFAFNGVGIAAKNAGGAVGKFGSALLAFAGPLAAAGAVGGAILFINSEFERMNTALKESFERLQDVRVELGEISKLGVLNRRAAAAVEAKPEVGIWDTILAGIGMRVGNYEPLVAAAGKAVMDIEAAKKKAQLELERYFEERYGMTITGGRVSPSGGGSRGYTPGPGALRGLGAGFTGARGGVPGTLQGVSPMPLDWGRSKEVKVAFDELTTEAQSFYSGMKAMTNELAGAISTYIGGAFKRVFGEGETLMGNLVSSFITAFISQGTSALVGRLIPMAGGGVITEPYVARGLHSGTLLTLGEQGPEMVMPMNSVTRTSHNSGSVGTAQIADAVAGLTSALRKGVWRAKGSELRYVLNTDLKYDRARRV